MSKLQTLGRQGVVGSGQGAGQHKLVCAGCFEDYGVRNFITQQLGSPQESPERGECSYCHDGEGVPLRWVADHIHECLLIEWEDAAESTPWEDGEYLFPTQTTAELLWECGLEPKREEIIDDIADLLPDNAWVEKHYPVGDEHERMAWGWDSFCDFVKHRSRYFFLHPSSYEEEQEEARNQHGMAAIVPHDMLSMLGKVASGTVVTNIPGELIYRARVGFFREEKDLREPPPQEARVSNRMSPAGIPMFYGCNRQQAALRETYKEDRAQNGDIVTVGKFESVAPFETLELALIPKVPSLFDESKNRERQTILSLRQFAKEIAAPVAKDGREHIDYVPTQIFTEYIRTNSLFADAQVSGVGYLSPLRNDYLPESEEWTCTALFESKERLKLVGVDHFRVSVEESKGGKVKFHKITLQGGS